VPAGVWHVGWRRRWEYVVVGKWVLHTAPGKTKFMLMRICYASGAPNSLDIPGRTIARPETDHQRLALQKLGINEEVIPPVLHQVHSEQNAHLSTGGAGGVRGRQDAGGRGSGQDRSGAAKVGPHHVHCSPMGHHSTAEQPDTQTNGTTVNTGWALRLIWATTRKPTTRSALPSPGLWKTLQDDRQHRRWFTIFTDAQVAIRRMASEEPGPGG
jgi:hypothetical protein